MDGSPPWLERHSTRAASAYVLRQMMPVSDGVDTPEESTLGPRIETDERLIPRWTAKEVRQICLLELQEAWNKAIAWSHRVTTSESRNPDHGEYGPQSRPAVTRDGLSPKQTGRRMSGVKRQKAAARRISRGPNLSTASHWMGGSGRSSHAARSVASPSSLLDT